MSLRRPTAIALAGAFLLTGCGGDDPQPRDEQGRVAVDEVALVTPEGWERVDEPVEPPLLVSTRFVDPDQGAQLVQVVAGCDEAGLDALVGSVGQPRGSLVVTGAEEHVPPPEVEGLQRARRVTLELSRADDQGSADARVEALYGQRGAALVLVEVSVPLAGTAPDVDADAVLDSVVTDGAALDARCGEAPGATGRP